MLLVLLLVAPGVVLRGPLAPPRLQPEPKVVRWSPLPVETALATCRWWETKLRQAMELLCPRRRARWRVMMIALPYGSTDCCAESVDCGFVDGLELGRPSRIISAVVQKYCAPSERAGGDYHAARRVHLCYVAP